MGKIIWFEEPSLVDIIITDPIEYFARPATIIICKLKQTSTSDATVHSLPVHETAEQKMNAAWKALRDKVWRRARPHDERC